MYRDRGFDREGLELMAKHYENKRKEKVQILLDVKVKLGFKLLIRLRKEG